VKTGSLIILILGISLLLGGWVSNYASTAPDGLESVVHQAGIISNSIEPSGEGSSFWLPQSLYGLGGVLLVFGLGSLLGRITQKRKSVS